MPKLINNVLVRVVRVIRVSDVVSLALGDFQQVFITVCSEL